MIRLGSGGEFDLIRALAARWGTLATGLGDDAATLTAPRGDRLVVSTDAAVEGIHFRRDWLSLREAGYRATAAALSDLAAMAATPLGILVAFTADPAHRDDLLEIGDGVGDAVRAAGTVIVGGNISAGSALTITTTVVGSAFEPLTRSGARAGDAVYVSGKLGGPAAAVRALANAEQPAPGHRQRLAAPSPRLREARWLAARGSTAMIDISDGLARDAEHLAVASGVSIHVDADRIPVIDGATFEEAAGGGEEYELLCAVSNDLDVSGFTKAFGLPLTRVGSVVASESPGVAMTRKGVRVAAPPGYDHFSR
ncbi:MAG: thiamine-phosphate kinase [Gemmatimonadaceae bacterium]